MVRCVEVATAMMMLITRDRGAASLEIGEPPSVLTRNNAWWDRLGCGGQDDYEVGLCFIQSPQHLY